MKLIYEDENARLSESLLKTLEEAAELCMKNEGVENPEAELSLTLLSEEEIREINREYRAVDAATDVLSFPQFEAAGEIPKSGPFALGDVVICPERAEAQAEEYGHSFEREFVYLFVHSMFHLLGYDHESEEERKEMRAREESVMAPLGLAREGEAEKEI